MREYVVWREGWTRDNDGEHIDAESPRRACEKWAEKSDYASADFSVIKGNDVTLIVAVPGEPMEQRYIVSGEAVPVYRARLATVGPNVSS